MAKPSNPTGGRDSAKSAPSANSAGAVAPNAVRLQTSNVPDLLAAKIMLVGAIAEAMPFNANRPGEHRFANAPGITLSTGDAAAARPTFIAGIARHRHPERETDPPMV
jgi:hypothetical protein